MQDVSVSIIIPFYNTGEKIKNMVDSVKNQTFKDYEVILINDGSTDNTCDILKPLLNDRFKLIHTQNQGVSKARNLGLQNATGKYILHVDSDDRMQPTYLQALYDCIVLNDADMVLCNYYSNGSEIRVVEQDCILDGKDVSLYLLQKNFPFNVFTKMVKKELNLQYPSNENIRFFAEDMALFCRLISMCNKVVMKDFAFYYYGYEKKLMNINKVKDAFENYNFLDDFFRLQQLQAHRDALYLSFSNFLKNTILSDIKAKDLIQILSEFNIEIIKIFQDKRCMIKTKFVKNLLYFKPQLSVLLIKILKLISKLRS